MTCEEPALADAAGDGCVAAEMEMDSNCVTEDAGDDGANDEGFLRFFAVGTGAGEAVETGESASGD